MEAFRQLCTQTELTPKKIALFWAQDPMAATHSLFCPNWTEIVKRHSMVNASSGSPADTQEEKVLRYLHTSPATAEEFLSKNSLGQRMCHHHFGLSQATIGENGVLIIGIMVSENFIIENALPAENGYSSSENIVINDLEQAGVTLHSCVQVAGSIVEELRSTATTELTRASISHYESLYEVSVLSEHRMASSEMLVALATETPHSMKVRSTLHHQTPEFFSMLMETIKVIKDAGAKEAKAQWESENVEKSKKEKKEEKSETSKQTSFQMCLSSDDECAISITKRAKTSSS
eukprot:1699435-Amphidinium_carterae.1